LLEYEVWNRIHVRGAKRAHDLARELFARIDLFQLDAERLACALEPFPLAVRTLDSLHLATIEYLRRRQRGIVLASFDRRMIAAAHALGISLYRM
jgi:hypothetical protein